VLTKVEKINDNLFLNLHLKSCNLHLLSVFRLHLTSPKVQSISMGRIYIKWKTVILSLIFVLVLAVITFKCEQSFPCFLCLFSAMKIYKLKLFVVHLSHLRIGSSRHRI
jgi:hypothetical protein